MKVSTSQPGPSLRKFLPPLALGAIVLAGSVSLFRPSYSIAPSTQRANVAVPPRPASTEPAKAPVAPTGMAPAASAPALETGRSAVTAAPIRAMPAPEVEKLYQRGQALIRVGDFAAARLLLGRASEAGHPGATFALASTYDPNVLARVRVQGLEGEPEQAKALYAKALAEGMQDAKPRLEALGG